MFHAQWELFSIDGASKRKEKSLKHISLMSAISNTNESDKGSIEPESMIKLSHSVGTSGVNSKLSGLRSLTKL